MQKLTALGAIVSHTRQTLIDFEDQEPKKLGSGKKGVLKDNQSSLLPRV